MSQETVTEPEQYGTLLEQARRLFEMSDLSGSFLLLKEHWLSTPHDVCAVQLVCEIMRKNGKQDLYKHLKILAQSQEALLNNVQAMFEAGYHFIEEREPELAVMLLQRCAQLEPDQSVIRYELGFALMQLRRFKDAIEQFEELLQHDGDFDTRLNLTVCHSLTRNLKRAKELAKELERLVANPEEKKELALRNWVIKRLEKFDSRNQMGIRDWVYALYGSVLLSDTTPKKLDGKARGEAADYPGVASTLIVLNGFLKELGLNFDTIEYYSPMSRPLAEAFGLMLDLPVDIYRGPDRKESALLMMAWASDIIGPHRSFVQHSPRRSIFAYGLTTMAQLPVTPDIIGCLAVDCAMPWTKELEELDTNEVKPKTDKQHPMNQIQEKATNQILENLRNLESHPALLNQIEELHSYYNTKREWLVLDNAKNFPERPEYTAEIPI